MNSLIGELIDKKGFKKKYIAAQLNVTPTQLSNWIGGRSYPTIEKAFKLADLLDVKVDELYERGDSNSS